MGAVATQSFVDPSYGKNGLDLMRAGKSASDTLKELLAKDEAREVRQGGGNDRRTGSSGCVDRQERHSGSRSHRRSKLFGSSQFDAQRSRLAGDGSCFESATGDLAE